MDRVAVVVLNYKGIEDTLSCFDSLLKQTYQNFHIVIIDNNSDDGSIEKLKNLEQKHNKLLTVIPNETNKGFAGGVNTGISWAIENDFPYVALFNNDAVADKGWLTHLMKSFRLNTMIGIVTCLLLHKDGKTIDSTGDWISKWGLPFPRNRNDNTKIAPESEYIFSASGGASVYKTELFKEIGLFDENFFAYYEDNDVSYRAQLTGWKVYYEKQAVAYHNQGATSKRMPGHFAVKQTFKNLPLLYIKNTPKGLLLTVGIRFYLAYFLMLANAVAKGKGKAALSGYALSIFLFWRSGLLKRRIIQKDKKVSTDYIRSMLWPDLPPDQTGLRKVRKLFTGK